jgi:hypothetical protein
VYRREEGISADPVPALKKKSLQPGFYKKKFLPIQSRLCKNNLCSPASIRRNFSRSSPGSEKIISAARLL